MKFLCPSCKAKYQIADEKVAGRSVKMKCRKCGHIIHISKAVTEGSVSRRLPDGALDSEAPPPSSARPPSSRKPPGPPPRRGAPRPRTGTPAPSSPQAPRPQVPRASQGREVTRTGPMASGSGGGVAGGLTPHSPVTHSPAPVAQRPTNGSNGNGSVRTGPLSALAESLYDDEEERTMIASAGALAGAFADAVRAPESSALALKAASDEWYVGINGVPVGPIRLSELRSKAAAGAITAASLVWREGFEEWLPLSTFPELVAIVEEGVSSARTSLTPMGPSYRPSQPAMSPAAPRPEVYDPFAAPASQPPSQQSDPFRAPASQQPSAVEAAPVSVVKGDVSDAALADAAGIPRSGGVSAAAWIAIVVALGFGLAIGFVMFSTNKPKEVIKYVEVPGKAAASAETQAPENVEAPSETASEDAGKQVAKLQPKPGQLPKPGEKPETGGGLQGLKGLGGLSAGPNAGPNSGGTTSSAAQPLDGAAVQRTVSRYTGSVKRSCWQPALDTRTKDAPSSARVTVTITVAPSGSVQSVSSSGDPRGYPGLAGCITSRVRGWQFPASNGTTTVNVPFVFAAQ